MRSTFPCTFSGRELISSRNSVPPSADSTSPTFPSRLAPVKLLTKWYENLARQLDIPVFFIDTCYNPMDCVTETRVRYVCAQIDQLIRDLCAFTGKTWDDERFKKVMEISQRNSYLWERANNLMNHKPAPIGGFELFNYMSAMVCNRGKESTTAIMEQLNAEMEQHIKEGRPPSQPGRNTASRGTASPAPASRSISRTPASSRSAPACRPSASCSDPNAKNQIAPQRKPDNGTGAARMK